MVTRADLLVAAGRAIHDLIAPGLRVLFCGINPGLYSAAVGHHFARPGNRFWPALHRAGFTDRQLHPSEERRLLELGFGITNLVARSSASAAELTDAEYVAGARRLKRKALRYRPEWIAFVGVGAYRIAFGKRLAGFGAQDDMLGPSRLWVLPSTSGLNANHQLPELTAAFRELREAAL